MHAAPAQPIRTPGSGIGRHARRHRWRRWGRWLYLVLLLVALGIAGRLAWDFDWSEVLERLANYRASTLLMVLAAVAVGHLAYASYDLLARHWLHLQPRLSRRHTLAVGFTSYACNLNLGSLLGGAGVRFRLYRRLGIGAGHIAQLYSLALATNWSGYFLLAGALFASGFIVPPERWPVSANGLRWVGAGFLALVAGYLLACWRLHDREFRVRGHRLRLPGIRLAGLQLLLAAISWSAMAATMYLLLDRAAPFPHVLGIALAASFAGVITRVPGGMGVLEWVYLSFLGASLGHGYVLAALLSYRAAYFLMPLALAGVLFFMMERATRSRTSTPRAA